MAPGICARIRDILQKNEFGSHRFINSLAWYTLKELKGKKILIVTDSTLNPPASYPYLNKDVALVTMPQSTLQQRAAFVLTMNQLVEQVTPIVVMLGFTDHLDINGLQKKLKDPNASTEVVAEAVISLYEGCTEVKTALRNEWRRTIFVSGPGYKHWPEPLKKATATVALAYREIEATLFAGDMQVNDELRPARMDYPCLLAELSKILSAMPLLEGVELTVDD